MFIRALRSTIDALIAPSDILDVFIVENVAVVFPSVELIAIVPVSCDPLVALDLVSVLLVAIVRLACDDCMTQLLPVTEARLDRLMLQLVSVVFMAVELRMSLESMLLAFTMLLFTIDALRLLSATALPSIVLLVRLARVIVAFCMVQFCVVVPKSVTFMSVLP